MNAAQANEEDHDLDDPDYQGGKKAQDDERSGVESAVERESFEPG